MKLTCDANYIERSPADPVTDIESDTLLVWRLTPEFEPFVPELCALAEDEGDECAEVLDGEGGCGHASLAFVHLAFGCEHAAADEARDERAGLPGLLVDARVLEDVCDRGGV